MSIGAILLRLLLCTALALNGVSVAHASLHPAHGQSMAAMPLSGTALKAEGAVPCHGSEHVSDSAAPQPAISQDTTSSECCKEGCQGACLQHATPAMTMALFPSFIAQDRVWQGGGIAHVPPEIVRLNRPPIA